MSEIGYYNYYNNPHRYAPATVQDRYQQMVDRYNSDELHASNQDPYSEENLAIRTLDEQLAGMAESVRSQCKTIDEVRHYLGLKYFGQEEFAFTKRQTDPETYAMYENDLNAICYGTVGGANRNDPRLNYTTKDWDTYEAEEKASRQKIISNQMSNLLKNNGITLNDDLLISFNPYSYDASIEGSSDLSMLSKITELLNSGRNSQELFYYTMQNSSALDAEALAKFRAYHNIMEYTGYDISELTLKDGEYYTSEGQSIKDTLKEKLDKDDSIGIEFKGAIYDYVVKNLDKTAKHGWNGTPDLSLSIGYNSKDGFYLLGRSWEA